MTIYFAHEPSGGFTAGDSDTGHTAYAYCLKLEMTMTDNYDTAKQALAKAEKRLQGWKRAYDDPKKFKPIMQAEFDRAFDKRERCVETVCRADPQKFVADFPTWAWLATYLGVAS